MEPVELQHLQREIEQIKTRNRRVETDKAWETSNTRRILIVALTYMVMTIVMFSLGNQRPYLDALIPTTGFFLSTLTLSFARHLWQHRK